MTTLSIRNGIMAGGLALLVAAAPFGCSRAVSQQAKAAKPRIMKTMKPAPEERTMNSRQRFLVSSGKIRSELDLAQKDLELLKAEKAALDLESLIGALVSLRSRLDIRRLLPLCMEGESLIREIRSMLSKKDAKGISGQTDRAMKLARDIMIRFEEERNLQKEEASRKIEKLARSIRKISSNAIYRITRKKRLARLKAKYIALKERLGNLEKTKLRSPETGNASGVDEKVRICRESIAKMRKALDELRKGQDEFAINRLFEWKKTLLRKAVETGQEGRMPSDKQLKSEAEREILGKRQHP